MLKMRAYVKYVLCFPPIFDAKVSVFAVNLYDMTVKPVRINRT